MRPLKTTIILVFSGLFIFSQFISPRLNWSEYFPFFHWSLYSHNQKYIEDYALKLADGSYVTGEEEYWMIQEAGQSRELKPLEKIIKRPAYLVKRKLDPIDFVKSQQVITEEIIASFE